MRNGTEGIKARVPSPWLCTSESYAKDVLGCELQEADPRDAEETHPAFVSSQDQHMQGRQHTREIARLVC